MKTTFRITVEPHRVIGGNEVKAFAILDDGGEPQPIGHAYAAKWQQVPARVKALLAPHFNAKPTP